MSIGYGGIVLVRYEEYIVGILFALISPYLRCLHLLVHQVTYVSLPWRYHPWRFEEYILGITGVPVRLKEYIVGILFPVLSLHICTAVIYWSTVSSPSSGYRDRPWRLEEYRLHYFH